MRKNNTLTHKIETKTKIAIKKRYKRRKEKNNTKQINNKSDNNYVRKKNKHINIIIKINHPLFVREEYNISQSSLNREQV